MFKANQCIRILWSSYILKMFQTYFKTFLFNLLRKSTFQNIFSTSLIQLRTFYQRIQWKIIYLPLHIGQRSTFHSCSINLLSIYFVSMVREAGQIQLSKPICLCYNLSLVADENWRASHVGLRISIWYYEMFIGHNMEILAIIHWEKYSVQTIK